MNHLLSKGTKIRIFLNNNYTYAGNILDIDDEAIKLYDTKTGLKIIVLRTEIRNIIEVEQ